MVWKNCLCVASSHCGAEFASALFLRKSVVGHTGDRGAHNRSQPEQPQLLKSPAAHEYGRSGAAGRVDGKIGDWNSDQMDEGQPETDRDRRESLWRSAVRSAENDHE